MEYKENSQEEAASQPEGHKSMLFQMMERAAQKKRAKEEAEASAEASTKDGTASADVGAEEILASGIASDESQQSHTTSEQAKDVTMPRTVAAEQKKAEVDATDVAQPVKPQPPPIDARVEIKVSSDRMRAAAVLTPPQNGGKHITAKQVGDAINERGIKVGINDSVFEIIERFQQYEKDLAVAGGIAPVNGVDGGVFDHYPRNQQLHPNVTEDGSVDFKDLSVVTNISRGTFICDIIPPSEPIAGKDVYGDPIEGRRGREPLIPQGRNTELSHDGLHLVASCDGNLVCVKDRFQIDDVLHINGNIDNEVGNIDFCGKIIVEGDVCEGFSLKSKKSIEIKGNVEGASVIAKEDITVKKGMNGMNKGLLQAGGDIKCKFLENCAVIAGGSVFTESAMNSTIQAEDKLIVEGKRSILVGGTYTAKNLVEAKVVGSEAHVPTTIVMGISPEKLLKFKVISEQLTTLDKELTALALDISYLEDRETRGRPLETVRASQLMEKRKLKTMNLFKTGQLSKELKVIQDGMESSKKCHLSCKQIFPPTQIVIGNVNYTVRAPEQNKLFFLDNGEIKMGML